MPADQPRQPALGRRARPHPAEPLATPAQAPETPPVQPTAPPQQPPVSARRHLTQFSTRLPIDLQDRMDHYVSSGRGSKQDLAIAALEEYLSRLGY